MTAQWMVPFEKLAAEVTSQVQGAEIHLAYMESADPLLIDVIQKLANSGVRHISTLPLFLSSGTHITKDIPEILRGLEEKNVGLKIEQLPPIGQHPRFPQLLRDLVLDYVGN